MGGMGQSGPPQVATLKKKASGSQENPDREVFFPEPSM
jgi:hypothetical protein